LAAMAEEGHPFRGLLYAGLMITADGPKVVEFNARFGDPETQVVLPARRSSDLEPMLAIARGDSIAGATLQWKDAAALTTVLAAAGYPDRPRRGDEITIPAGLEESDDVFVFHAGTKKVDGRLITDGGRVLAVTAVAPTLAEAAERSRAAAESITFAGRQYRRDIGWRELARRAGAAGSGDAGRRGAPAAAGRARRARLGASRRCARAGSDAAQAREPAARPTHRGRDAARQERRARVRGRAPSRDQSRDDRPCRHDGCAARGGDATRGRALRAGRWPRHPVRRHPALRLPRSPGCGRLAPARRGARARAAERRIHARSALGTYTRLYHPDTQLPPRPAQDRRCGQHLRERGSLPRGDPA